MNNPVTALLVFFGLVAAGFVVWYVIRHRVLGNKDSKVKTQIEDILKQLYHVEYSGNKASLNDMSGALKIDHGKLVMLIERASDANLITTDNTHLQLTEEGREYALRIIRVHRLWEKYLSEKTGFAKEEWHDRAELMEHKLSPGDAEDLDSELGYPRFDPHGDPIPTRDGEIFPVKWIPLSALVKDKQAVIAHIEDEPEVIYKQILSKKLHVGSQLKVLTSSDNLMSIFCEGKNIDLPSIVAANISVREMTESESFDENAIRLSELESGKNGKIIALSSECRGANRRRLLDLGFIPGTQITPQLDSPLKNPRAYMVKDTLIALRDNQAENIIVEEV